MTVACLRQQTVLSDSCDAVEWEVGKGEADKRTAPTGVRGVVRHPAKISICLNKQICLVGQTAQKEPLSYIILVSFLFSCKFFHLFKKGVAFFVPIWYDSSTTQLKLSIDSLRHPNKE